MKLTVTFVFLTCIHAFHAQWCEEAPDNERCIDCRAVLVPCDCQPGCPGGKCPVCK